jgi:predicted nucleotidyltransferase
VLARVEEALVDFAAWARARFGARLHDLRLFGSVARGDAHEDSDVDVAVVVDDLTGSEAREIGHYAGDMLTAYDILLCPFAVSTQRMALLASRERRIAQEIENDGIPL